MARHLPRFASVLAGALLQPLPAAAQVSDDPLPPGAILRLGSPHLRPALGHVGEVSALAYSADGKLLASGGADRRRLRAIGVLEAIGSSEARDLLAHLASGAPQAPLTAAARRALERLNKGP